MTSLRLCPQYGPVLLLSLDLLFLMEMRCLPLNHLSNPRHLPPTRLTRVLVRLQLILSMLGILFSHRRDPLTPAARLLPRASHESSTTRFGLFSSSFLAAAHLSHSN